MRLKVSRAVGVSTDSLQPQKQAVVMARVPHQQLLEFSALAVAEPSGTKSDASVCRCFTEECSVLAGAAVRQRRRCSVDGEARSSSNRDKPVENAATSEARLRCVLPAFDLAETLRCGREIRHVVGTALTLEQGAQQMCDALYESLVDVDGVTRACALVRCFITHPLDELPEDLRAFVASTHPAGLSPTAKTLVLLGTAGDEPAWKSRHGSKGHKAIPLPSAEVIDRAPMIAGLLKDLGVDVRFLVTRDRSAGEGVRAKTYGVFYVENAVGSPVIPAQQEFVARYGISSVIGCGGELPGDEMFATIFFCRPQIAHKVAERFRALALDMKSAFFALAATQTFNR